MSHTGFLRDICEHPADDTVRLIYADWLGDQGEHERAELIRVQLQIPPKMNKHTVGSHMSLKCAFRNPNPKNCLQCRYGPLLDKQADLLAEDGPLCNTFDRYFSTPEGQGFWIGGRCYYAVFRRGFVAEITCTSGSWQDHGPVIVRQQPIDRVNLSGLEPRSISKTVVWVSESIREQFPDNWQPVERALVPSPIFALLSGGYEKFNSLPGIGERHYPDRRSAIDALSAACLKWASRLTPVFPSSP